MKYIAIIVCWMIPMVLEAHTIELTIGKKMPKEAQSASITKTLTLVDSSESWLHTTNGDYLRRCWVYKDKQNRFTLALVADEGILVKVYLLKGVPKWDEYKSKRFNLPHGSSVLINCKTGYFVIKGDVTKDK